MSCYVCQNEIFSEIAGFLATIENTELGYIVYNLRDKHNLVVSKPEALAMRLYELNCFSVDERYGRGQSKEFAPDGFKYISERYNFPVLEIANL